MSIVISPIMKTISLFSLAFLLLASCSKHKTPSVKIRYEVDSLLDLAQDYSASLDVESSLQYAFKALELAQSSNFRKGIAESYFYISQALFDTGNHDKSMQYITLGEGYADRNPQLKSEFISIRARIYSYLGLQEKAKDEFLKSLTYTKQISQQLHRDYFTALAYENLSHLYMIIDCLDSALLYTHKEIEILTSMDDSIAHTALINAYTDLGTFKVYENKIDSAHHFYNKAIELARKYNYPYYQRIYFHKGDMFLSINNTDSALYYYYKALANLDELGLKAAYPSNYERLSKTLLLLNDTATALEFENKKFLIEKELDKNKLEAAKNMITLLINQEKELKTEQNKRYFISGVAIIILLSILVFIWLFSKRYKVKSYRQKGQEIEIQKVMINRSLTEVIELAKKNDPAFMPKFQKVYPNFTNILFAHYPNLLLSELQMLAFIYLGFTNKEISDFTHRSFRTIENRKYRLRKKLNIDTEIDMYYWLNEFFQRSAEEKNR
mgnify:FL=1